MNNAVIYTRVSTRAQEDGYSLKSQKKDGETYCQKQGYRVVAEESDVFTGHDSLAERDGMQRAIQLINRGDADVLVIWKVDRAGRFMVDNLLLLREVSDAGGRLESVSEGLIPNTPTGKLLLSVHSFAAETEWEDIRKRTQRGITERIAKGHILASAVPLFGYKWEGARKETYAIDEEAAQVVRDMYNKASEGWSVRRICRWLNEKNTPTPSKLLSLRGELPTSRKIAETWERNTAHNVLTDESYTGKHSARHWENLTKKVRTADGREKTVKWKRERSQTDETQVAVTIPAIIDREQWETVQQKIKARQLDNAGDESAVLLNRGIAYCGMCGAKMIAANHRGIREYACTNRRSYVVAAEKACPGNTYAIRSSVVDPDVWAKVKDIIRDQPRFQRLVKSKAVKLEEQHADAVRTAENVERELADMRARQAVVYERMTRETDDTIYAMHRAELQRLNKSVAQLERRSKEVENTLTSTQQHQDAHQMLLNGIAAMLRRHGEWKRLTEQYLEEQGIPVTNAETLMLRVIEGAAGFSLDALTREEKRDIMRAIDLKVTMYPKDSEFARTHEQRWDVEFSPDVLLSHTPACR